MGNTNATKYSVTDEVSEVDNKGKSKINQSRSSHSLNGQTPSDYPDFIVKLGKILITKSSQEEKQVGICKAVFQKYVVKESRSMGFKLFEYFLTKEGIHRETEGENYEKKTLSLSAFVRQSNVILNCLTDTQQIDYYIKVFANDREEMARIEFFDLISAAYEIAQYAHHSVCLPDNLLSALCKAVMHGKEKTTCKYIFNWVCQHCPRIFMWMHRYISHTLTVGYSTVPKDESVEEEDNETPILDSANRSSCASLHPALIWLLSSSLPPSFIKSSSPTVTPEEPIVIPKDPRKLMHQLLMAGKPTHWIPLFNTDEHGLSINRFKHHVFDYHGPTLLFITTDDESMFCVASDEEWRDSKHFYGGSDSMCFQLYPEYKVIEKGAKMLYFNISSRGFPTGLQVGVDNTNRSLCVDINLELVHYKKIPYRLKSLEVWGCGTRHDKEKQIEYKKQAKTDVEKRRKINVGMEWKDNPDRYLLEMAGTRPNYARFEKDTQNHSSLK